MNPVFEILSDFSKVLEVLGIENYNPVITGLPENEIKALLSLSKLSLVSEAAWKLAEEKIDWDDWDQRKYFAWAFLGSSGSGFRFSDYGYVNATSYVGSHLVFPDSEVLKFVFEAYKEDYKAFMLK